MLVAISMYVLKLVFLFLGLKVEIFQKISKGLKSKPELLIEFDCGSPE